MEVFGQLRQKSPLVFIQIRI